MIIEKKKMRYTFHLNQNCLRKTVFITLKIPKPQSGTMKSVVIKSFDKMFNSNKKNPTYYYEICQNQKMNLWI